MRRRRRPGRGCRRGRGVGWGAQRAAVYGVPESDLGAFYAQRTLLKREVLPEHVAAAVLVLTAGDLSHTTGLHIPVDRSSHDLGARHPHRARARRVSVEFDVQPGPVTLLGLGQRRDGRYMMVASEGSVVPGPLLRIGNTTSRVDFGCDPGEWTDLWSAPGVDHHRALGTGHRAAELEAVAELVGVEFVHVQA